jgi:hypothetical protein
MLRASATAAAVVAIAAAAALPAGAARPAASGPLIDQMVVFSDGSAKLKTVRASQITVKVGHKRCGVAAGTPLAALVRSRVATLSLTDYGACSAKPRDAAGLYVRKIGPDRGTGNRGWVYKVGQRQGTAGAADPGGPFGRGRIRRHTSITWFYCHLDRSGGCERTLAVTPDAPGARALSVTVAGFDDEGHSKPVAGATVHAGSATATTDGTGVARFTLAPGSYSVYATAPGTIRSFPQKVQVR